MSSNNRVRRIATWSIVIAWIATATAQQPPSEPRFEVASVKPNTSDAPPSSRFPLGPGDAYVPGTLFAATNQPLINYIRFAFGRSQGELLRLPSWVYDERFDVQGRAAGEPGKDDMRLMVRALLAERFNLAWHIEPRDEAVLELVLAESGRLGPQLTPHAGTEDCAAQTARDPRFRAIPCGSAGLVAASSPGRSSIAGRKQPIAKLAGLLSNNAFAGIDRPVLDRTGLSDDFDFIVEWSPPPTTLAPTPSAPVDDSGPGLSQALRDQLGLRLRSGRAAIDTLVIDRVERPVEN